MSASRSSSVVWSLVALVCALLASACAAPGAERLQGTPEGMPEAVRYLPADSLGWMLATTDVKRRDAVVLAEQFDTTPQQQLEQLAEPFVGADADWAKDVEPWIGGSMGRALYTSREPKASMIHFADVRKRDALERALRGAGWKQRDERIDAGADDDLRLWTRGGDGAVRALGVTDSAVIGTRTVGGMRRLMRATRKYDAAGRQALAQFSVDALKGAPLSVVFRSDQVRNDLRTLVSDSPALVEFSRWATSTSSIYALRDGWAGVVPAKDDHVRITGRMDWARAATDVPEPQPVERPTAEQLAGSDWGVAIDDPGAYLDDALEAISDGGIEFVTDEDAPKGAPKLRPLLEELDGGALLTVRAGVYDLRIDSDDPRTLSSDLRAGIDAVSPLPVPYDVEAVPDATGVDLRVAPRSEREQIIEPGGDVRPINAAFGIAGTSATKPVAWVYLDHAGCDAERPLAGWFAWHHGSQRLTWSIAVPIGDCAPVLPL